MQNGRHRVRVMTWNVWWRFGPQWRERQPLIVRTLREVDADVMALQEVWGDKRTTQVHEFAERLGVHAAFAAPALPPPPDPPETPDQRGIDVGVGLISRWPIGRTETIPMPSRHRTPAPVAMVAEVAHPSGSLPVIVACLEWEPAYGEDRLAQSSALAALAANPSLDGALPVIVAGDLNAPPGSSMFRPLSGLIDAWAAGGGDPNVATLTSSHPSAPLEAHELIDRRIDHVLVRPGLAGQHISVERAGLAGVARDGLDPSDHLAVVCDISWHDTRAD
jgi:endonuclease/exonuclease/phosphatase family metal-dependent hydrolase